MTLEEAVIFKLRDLPKDKQQEVVDFIEFLLQQVRSTSELAEQTHEVSVFDAAGDLLGCVEGPTDLSTNDDYLEGYGI